MKLSPAPTSPQRPDCAARSSARGAGVHFATDPCLASWDEGYTGLGSGTMQNTGTSPERVGGIRFQQVPAGAGDIGAKAWAC